MNKDGSPISNKLETPINNICRESVLSFHPSSSNNYTDNKNKQIISKVKADPLSNQLENKQRKLAKPINKNISIDMNTFKNNNTLKVQKIDKKFTNKSSKEKVHSKVESISTTQKPLFQINNLKKKDNSKDECETIQTPSFNRESSSVDSH